MKRIDLPSNLDAHRRMSIAEAAVLSGVSPKYFRDCLTAFRDESFRLNQGIPRNTLRDLPLQHWEKRGGRWKIKHIDLMRQISS